MPARILVIRGGAIGDFVLTLPALRLLRENFADAHIEILGYKHIVALADGRYYANGSRSIEYGPLATFFTAGGKLDPELCDYFASFDLVISFLYDPDEVFETNLLKARVQNLIKASPQVNDEEYAARQLARPLERIALFLDEPASYTRADNQTESGHPAHPRLFPNEDDERAAGELLSRAGAEERIIALHPGSGSPRKNWPPERWARIIGEILRDDSLIQLILLSGEADNNAVSELKFTLGRAEAERVSVIHNQPLPVVAALLRRARLFLGHDSGISHIAAAVGTPSILLYGPTSATTWGPQSANVTIICSATDDMAEIDENALRQEIRSRLRGEDGSARPHQGEVGT